jgi:hypothetical protein
MPPVDSSVGAGKRAKNPALRLYHGVNLAVGLFWLLVLIEILSPVRIPIADYGVPIGMLVLFFGLPAMVPFLWRAERRRLVPSTPARRAYCIASRLLLGLSWLPTWIPVLFLLSVWQPWPLTLREGPDTDFARDGYARIFGGPPAGWVHGIHYRVDGARDPIFFLRCEGVDRRSVDGVVQRLGLQVSAATELSSSASAGRVPSWWPQAGLRFDAAFQRREGWTALWYRERDGLLLYREVTF